LSAAEPALLWCSGKDLLAAMEPWLHTRGQANAGAFRGRLRDWVRAHPSEVLKALPELAGLVAALRSQI
jgi:hypothetical protein